MVWVARDFKDCLIPKPLPLAGTPFIRLLRAPSVLALNRDGAPPL